MSSSDLNAVDARCPSWVAFGKFGEAFLAADAGLVMFFS